MKIIIINGYPESGKDTFIDCCEHLYSGSDFKISRVWASTPAKDALKVLGWDGETKTPKIRARIATLKKVSDVLFDGTFKYLEQQVADCFCGGVDVLFIHARDPKEIKRFVEIFEAVTVLISRNSTLMKYSNSADNNVWKYSKYDFIVPNEGTIEDLIEQAKKFLEVMVDGN